MDHRFKTQTRDGVALVTLECVGAASHSVMRLAARILDMLKKGAGGVVSGRCQPHTEHGLETLH